MLQESGVLARNSAELNTAKLAVWNLENLNSNLNVVGYVFVEFVGCEQRKLDFVLVFTYQWLNLQLGSYILDQGIFNQIWIIAREELCFVSNRVIVESHLLQWLIECFIGQINLSPVRIGSISHSASHSSDIVSPLTHQLLSLSKLLLLLGIQGGLDGLLPLDEGSLDLVRGGNGHLHPRVSHDL